MSLRRQLFLVSLLLLSLPWAGCQFVREMEGALRTGQARSLQATARAVAAVAGEERDLLYPDPARFESQSDEGRSLYAPPAPSTMAVDGYADGWEDVPTVEFSDAGLSMPLAVRVRAVTRDGRLFLLVQVQDPEVIYHNPGLSREPNGDRLVLRTWQRGRRQDYVVATAAPGRVRARAAGRRDREANPDRIHGYWQDARGGYSLELELPLSYTGERLGFYVVNGSARAGAPFETLGNMSPLDSGPPPWLIHSSRKLQAALAPFKDQGNRILLADRHRWLVGTVADPGSRKSDSHTFWLLRLLYRSILRDDQLTEPPPAPVTGKVAEQDVASALGGKPANLRYRDPQHRTRTILVASAPVFNRDEVIGAVVVQQSGEQYLSLTDQAFSRLLGYSMLAIGIGAMGLLSYASLLSWRIGRLSRAARQVIAEDGSILGHFPRSRVKDEIGDLSRHYAELLDRVRDYNNYLHTLSRKLAHELRTPIAVIETSLENLEHGAQEQDAAIYLERARDGLKRLNNILTAMSEANQLEQSIRSNQRREFDLVPLLQEVFAAYRDIYRRHQLTRSLAPGEAPTCAVPELVVQALDKLMDNAASFTPPGGKIELGLEDGGDEWLLRVRNEGPPLPGGAQDRLFEPMVSLRDEETGAVHLGLGLHIVSLINDYHGGRVYASNEPGNRGVCFTMTLRKS